MKSKQASRLILGILVLMVLILGCENPTGSDDPGHETPVDPVETVDPPENLVGTIALADGTSAVVNISFTAASSSVTARSAGNISASSTYSINGTVRYNEADFAVSGTYDGATAALAATATNSVEGTFTVDGTYDSDEGFSGTVTFTPIDGEEIAGSVHAVGVTDADRSSISVFVGSYGGSTYGSWNGTLTTDRFYGTFAASDGSGDSGNFSADFADGEVSGGSAGSNTEDQVPFGGILAEDGESIGGWFAGDVVEDGVTYEVSGTWSGVKVDGNNDAPAVGADSEGEVIANRFLQTLGSLIRRAEDLAAAEESVTYEEDGQTVVAEVDSTDVVVRLTASFDGEPSEETFEGWDATSITLTGEGYTDTVTGVTIGPGEIYATYDTSRTASSIRQMTTLIIDSDVDDDPEERNDGVTITFSDATSADLYVNGTIDTENETVGGTWDYGPDPTDVASFVEGALF